MKAFLQIAPRIREFIPDAVFKVYITGDAPSPTTENPQIILAHKEALIWGRKQLDSGRYEVFNRAALPEDFESVAVWCYPTHIPQPGDSEVAKLAQMHGAIPVFNPIGIFVDEVFAGIPCHGIPGLDPLVRCRYAYETIHLLHDPALQESIRGPMMEYARSREHEIVCASSKIEGWMTAKELSWLVEKASQALSVAEIGCWKGRSTTALAKACCNGTVYAVDHWFGGKDEPEHIRTLAANGKVYEEFMSNIGNCSNVAVIRSSSTEAAGEILKSVDMAFIDAGHGYGDVVADIRAWRPKTLALICGHDYNFPDVQRAVADELGDVETVTGTTIWFKWIGVEARSNAAD